MRLRTPQRHFTTANPQQAVVVERGNCKCRVPPIFVRQPSHDASNPCYDTALLAGVASVNPAATITYHSPDPHTKPAASHPVHGQVRKQVHMFYPTISLSILRQIFNWWPYNAMCFIVCHSLPDKPLKGLPAWHLPFQQHFRQFVVLLDPTPFTFNIPIPVRLHSFRLNTSTSDLSPSSGFPHAGGPTTSECGRGVPVVPAVQVIPTAPLHTLAGVASLFSSKHCTIV